MLAVLQPNTCTVCNVLHGWLRGQKNNRTMFLSQKDQVAVYYQGPMKNNKAFKRCNQSTALLQWIAWPGRASPCMDKTAGLQNIKEVL